MTDEEAAKVGKMLRNAAEGNLLAGSFAAELCGESYPFDKAQCDIVFAGYNDTHLGHRFDKWMQEHTGK